MTIDPNSLIGKAGMSEMEIQQARANAILADFAAGVNEAVQTPAQMVSEAMQKNQIEIPDQRKRPVYEYLPAIETP